MSQCLGNAGDYARSAKIYGVGRLDRERRKWQLLNIESLSAWGPEQGEKRSIYLIVFSDVGVIMKPELWTVGTVG